MKLFNPRIGGIGLRITHYIVIIIISSDSPEIRERNK